MTIDQSTCQRCAACCHAVVDGEVVACRHLIVGERFACAIYATRPQVCRDYSCVRDGRISEAVAERVMAAVGRAV